MTHGEAAGWRRAQEEGHGLALVPHDRWGLVAGAEDTAQCDCRVVGEQDGTTTLGAMARGKAGGT